MVAVCLITTNAGWAAENVRPSLIALTQALNGGDSSCQMYANFARQADRRFPDSKRDNARKATDCVLNARAAAEPLYATAIADEPRAAVKAGIKSMYVKWNAYVDGISGYEPIDRDGQRAFAEARMSVFLDADLNNK